MVDRSRELPVRPRLELICGVSLLHPEDAVLHAMLQGWENQVRGRRRISLGTIRALSSRHVGISAGLHPHGHGVDVLRSLPQPGLEDGDTVRHPLDVKKSDFCQGVPRKPLGHRPEFVVTEGQKFLGKESIDVRRVLELVEIPQLDS